MCSVDLHLFHSDLLQTIHTPAFPRSPFTCAGLTAFLVLSFLAAAFAAQSKGDFDATALLDDIMGNEQISDLQIAQQAKALQEALAKATQYTCTGILSRVPERSSGHAGRIRVHAAGLCAVSDAAKQAIVKANLAALANDSTGSLFSALADGWLATVTPTALTGSTRLGSCARSPRRK